VSDNWLFLIVRFLGAPLKRGSLISGFDLGDEIGLHSLGFGSSSSALSWMRASSDAAALDVDVGGWNISNLTLLGQFAAANFNAGADGHGGKPIIDLPSTVPPFPDPVASMTVAHS
jgi:hypothetical protein